MSRRVLGVVVVLGALAAGAGPASAIFQGRAIDAAEAPWLATFSRGGVVCGGALVAPDLVLTAAHCVQGVDPARLPLRLGGGPTGAGPPLAWTGAIFPRGYRELPSPEAPDDPRKAATVGDVALVRLARPVTGVAPLPIADGTPPDGTATRTIGRGRTGPVERGGRGPGGDDPGAPPPRPLAADQVVVATATCREPYPTLLRPGHLCTQDASPAAAQACTGDSGSPVLVDRGGAPAVAAVVTWGGETRGRDCGGGLPDVSELVAAHVARLRAGPQVAAPYALRRVRVRRTGRERTCVIGPWRPAAATFRVRWWREEARAPVRRDPRTGALRIGEPRRRHLAATGRTIRVAGGPVGCTVRATTTGGWAQEESYNAR